MAMAERVVRLADSFAPDPDYRISVDAVVEHHRIVLGGVTIADSDEVLVLHETRLEPTYYFPKAHVRMDLMEATDHSTFCPFKGNASYWTVRVGEHSAENALWGYEEPFPEVHEIGGYVSFYRDRMDSWFVDGKPLDGYERSAVRTDPSGVKENPFVDWLLREAWDATTTRELVRRFANALNEAGLSVMRMNVVIPTLHPLLVAHSYRWSRDSGEVVRNAASNETFESQQYRASPLPVIFEGEGGIRRWVDAKSANDFPIFKDLYEAGATEYVAMPVRFSDGQINALTMATDRPDGFTTEALGHVHEVVPLLSRLFEVHAKARTAATLLETFVGKHTGQRVLNGSIKRGDGEDIHAVIWFCDMRQSTPLAETLSRREFLDHLNRFFDCMAGAVIDNGGEVLRFIGDAVLAIFPIGTDEAACRENACAIGDACKRSITAALDAQARIADLNEALEAEGKPPIDFGIGLHIGEVTYGNIGIPERLEFTVVGAAANEAARIEALSKETEAAIVISEAFAGNYQGDLTPLGDFSLRGVNGTRQVFTIPDDA